MEGIINLTLVIIKNHRSDRIKADSNVIKERHKRQFRETNSVTKERRDVGNKSEPDMSVLRVRVKYRNLFIC